MTSVNRVKAALEVVIPFHPEGLRAGGLAAPGAATVVKGEGSLQRTLRTKTRLEPLGQGVKA